MPAVFDVSFDRPESLAMVSQISVLGCSDYDGTSCITAAAHAKWPAHAASLRPQARHTWICPLKVVSKIATSI